MAISLILVLSYYGRNVGNFMINLDKEAFLKQGLSISETADFKNPSSRLLAEPIRNAEAIGERGNPGAIPKEISTKDYEFGDGSNNGKFYMAYSFYIRNIGTKSVNYSFNIDIEEATKNTDAAIRVMLIKESNVGKENVDKEVNVYAKIQGEFGESPGEPEVGTIPFTTQTLITTQKRNEFNVGDMDRYTVIVWLHGEDADCTNEEGRSILNGIIKLSMGFKVLNN